MKKFLGICSLLFAIVACALFGGLHVGTACPADAKDFANHVAQQGHIAEFGGAGNFYGFLNAIANGGTQIAVYGDAVRTIIAVTSSQYGLG